MSALTDLQGAVATLGSNVAAELAEIATKLSGSVSSADVESAVAQINTISGSIAAETASLIGTSTSTGS